MQRSGASAERCGDGHVDPGEQCDHGPANSATAYGPDLCTDACKVAPRCGDKIRNGGEACDGGEAGTFALADCNPECTGFYEKKTISKTLGFFKAGEVGGIPGADAKCQAELGARWKALIVGGARRATLTPLLGDGQLDWVIQKYTYYYTASSELIWRTDDVSLLGVRDGKRTDVYANVFPAGNYPWSGWNTDWTTIADNAALYQGTCAGWTNTSAGYASFCSPDLSASQSEDCGSSSFILCVEQ